MNIKSYKKDTSVKLKEINQISDRLSSLIDPFEYILQSTAPKFLYLGQMLEDVHSNATKITRMTLKAIQIGGDESNQSLLNDITVLAERSLKQLEKNSDNVIENLKGVKSSMKYLDKLHRSVNQMRDTSKTLNMISLNIAIESSRSSRCEEIFGHFVKEITELANRVNVISRNIYDDLKFSQSKQQDIMNDIIVRTNQLNKITATANEMIHSNIDRIKHLFDISQEKLKKSMDHSKEISRHIGAVIESIQFEDITKQQLEHILQAIQDTEGLCIEKNCWEDNQSVDTEILSQVHSILTIQAAQIKHVIFELLEIHKKILSSFSDIDRFVGILTEGTSDSSYGQDIRNEMGAPFEELISGFINLDEILKQGYNLSEKIEEAFSKSVEITSKLSLHIGNVEEISLDLHIKAINAILSQIGLALKA